MGTNEWGFLKPPRVAKRARGQRASAEMARAESSASPSES
jgi:hypothetical protein